MRWLHKLSMQIRMLFRRNEEGARLDDELQFHLDQQIAENIAAGMSSEEATHAAMPQIKAVLEGDPAKIEAEREASRAAKEI